MRRILLVDADSQKGFPNLALMKLSSYHKSEGDHIDLIKGIPTTQPLDQYDKGYISCIFFQNAEAVRDYQSQLLFPTIIGGSGWDYRTLPSHIEHIMPDYSLYDVDFSMGFTSRGCIRNCPWCIVPHKEGGIRDHAAISEFHDPQHKKIMLLDNNFFVSPKWTENLQYIIDNKLKVNFNQGLDIRTINNHMASMLSQTKYYSWHFKQRGIHFAFDSMSAKKGFIFGMKTLLDNGIPAHHIMVYVLVGFDTTINQDLERVKIITDFGALPYIMRYNQRQDDEKLNHLARWINGRYYQFISIEEYNGGVLVS